MAASSYKSLFRTKTTIYHFGDLQVPFPITVDMLALFSAYAALIGLLYALIPPLGNLLSPWEAIPVGAGVGAWLSDKLEPAGKSVPAFLWGLLEWALRPKLTVAGRAVKLSKQRLRLAASAAPVHRGEVWELLGPGEVRYKGALEAYLPGPRKITAAPGRATFQVAAQGDFGPRPLRRGVAFAGGPSAIHLSPGFLSVEPQGLTIQKRAPVVWG